MYSWQTARLRNTSLWPTMYDVTLTVWVQTKTTYSLHRIVTPDRYWHS